MDKRPKQTAFNDWDPAHKTEYNITQLTKQFQTNIEINLTKHHQKAYIVVLHNKDTNYVM